MAGDEQRPGRRDQPRLSRFTVPARATRVCRASADGIEPPPAPISEHMAVAQVVGPSSSDPVRMPIGLQHGQDFVVGVRLQPLLVPVAG